MPLLEPGCTVRYPVYVWYLNSVERGDGDGDRDGDEETCVLKGSAVKGQQ